MFKIGQTTIQNVMFGKNFVTIISSDGGPPRSIKLEGERLKAFCNKPFLEALKGKLEKLFGSEV